MDIINNGCCLPDSGEYEWGHSEPFLSQGCCVLKKTFPVKPGVVFEQYQPLKFDPTPTTGGIEPANTGAISDDFVGFATVPFDGTTQTEYTETNVWVKCGFNSNYIDAITGYEDFVETNRSALMRMDLIPSALQKATTVGGL